MRSLSPLSRRILEKSRYRRRFFLLRFSFWLCSVPLYLPCAPKGSPSFSLCCAGDTCFFRFDARPLLCAENWGLSFPEKGKTPVGNATSEELAAYNAWFAASPEENIIYLTFDCGYENGNTPAILDALQKHQAPAAFFVVGNFLSDQPDLVKRMAAEGHIVGNHTWSHPDMSKISTQEAFSGRAEPCFRSLPGDHQPGNGEILPASAGKIQHAEPADGKRSRLSDFFLESCLCRLVPGSAADPRGGFQKVDRTHSSRCHRPAS